MKIICNKDNLLNGINIVSKAVSSKTTLPILECILIKTEEEDKNTKEGFKLTGNDLEIGIETSVIEATVHKHGTIAIEAKLFFDIIRRVNGSEVELSTDENNMVTIKSGTSEFNIMGQNGDEFPEIPRVESENRYSLKQKDLRDMITKTIFSIALDESKPVLTGELVEISGDKINMVAVDGYRISYRESNLEPANDSVNVVVPGKTLREISKVLNDSDEPVNLFITDKHILFEFEGNTVVSRILEGDFIKYDQTFTNEYKTAITSDRAELISALERASLMSRDARKVPVKIDIQDNKIILNSQTEMGMATEEVYVDVEGDRLKIAFNPKYLIDALRAIDDECINIQFNTSLSPCIIKPVEGDIYKYLILPLRV